MIFSDFYKNPRSPLARLRPNHQELPPTTPEWNGDEYADLLSKDKTKQKEAVKRYLHDKVKNDWTFSWPPEPVQPPPEQHDQQIPENLKTEGEDRDKPNEEIDLPSDESKPVQDELLEDEGYQVDATESDDQASKVGDDDADSIYSIISEDGLHYRPRAEWTSELSDDEATFSSPFRFDSPDAVGSAVRASTMMKRTLRRRAIRNETTWNDGLACFEARRNAWTSARTVRVRSKPVSPPPISPRSPRRFFFRRSMSGSPPNHTPLSRTQTGDGSGMTSDGSSLAKENDKEVKKQGAADPAELTPADPNVYPVETLLPLGQPLLPPNNPLRASITPPVYLNLYDKVILHNLQPSCPINLGDMLRSCVAGWKRDGEWPPRPSAPDPSMVIRRKKKKATPAAATESSIGRRMSFGILGRDRDDESKTGKGIRRSLQRALGLGSSPTPIDSTGPGTVA